MKTKKNLEQAILLNYKSNSTICRLNKILEMIYNSEKGSVPKYSILNHVGCDVRTLYRYAESCPLIKISSTSKLGFSDLEKGKYYVEKYIKKIDTERLLNVA